MMHSWPEFFNNSTNEVTILVLTINTHSLVIKNTYFFPYFNYVFSKLEFVYLWPKMIKYN